MTWSPDIADVVTAVLSGSDTATSADGPDAESWRLWGTMAELGWPWIGIPEDRGGVGGGLGDLVEIAFGIGRFGAMAPLLETSLTFWLLAELDTAPAEAAVAVTVCANPRLSIATDGDELVLDGDVDNVPWARRADVLVLAVTNEGTPGWLLVRDPAATQGLGMVESANLAAEPRDRVVFAQARVPATQFSPGGPDPGDVVVRAEALRVAAIAGAVRQACRVTRDYISTRVQFGRPLARLQAVAQVHGEMCAQRDLLETTVTRMVRANASRDSVAVAKVIADQIASDVAKGAHQLHGAIGITREHELHRSTRRLWAWRDEPVSGRRWAAELGASVASGDDATAWELTSPLR